MSEHPSLPATPEVVEPSALRETLTRWSRQGHTDDMETPIDHYGQRVLSMVLRELDLAALRSEPRPAPQLCPNSPSGCCIFEDAECRYCGDRDCSPQPTREELREKLDRYGDAIAVLNDGSEGDPIADRVKEVLTARTEVERHFARSQGIPNSQSSTSQSRISSSGEAGIPKEEG